MSVPIMNQARAVLSAFAEGQVVGAIDVIERLNPQISEEEIRKLLSELWKETDKSEIIDSYIDEYLPPKSS